MNIKDLEQQLSGHLPPVADWHPTFCGTMDLTIDRDGKWIHEGSEIQRTEMVKLFCRILRREKDAYFLVTPIEKIEIQVAIEPFVMIDAVLDQGCWIFEAKTGERVPLSEDHPMEIVQHHDIGDYPRILVRQNLWAHLHRNLFYRLAEQATVTESPSKTQLWLKSLDKNWLFGTI